MSQSLIVCIARCNCLNIKRIKKVTDCDMVLGKDFAIVVIWCYNTLILLNAIS